MTLYRKVNPKSEKLFILYLETGMVDALVVKTVAWENERDVAFTYDGVRNCF